MIVDKRNLKMHSRRESSLVVECLPKALGGGYSSTGKKKKERGTALEG